MIDTHTHIVSSDPARYPLRPRELAGRPRARGGQWYLEAPQTAEALMACMEDAGVEQAVLVQAVGAYTYDNDYAADSAVAHPSRFASACCIDPVLPDAAATLREWILRRGMNGVRLMAIAAEGASWLNDNRTDPVWREARELGAHVIVTILRHQLPELRQVLRRHPEVRVSLDHCGFPDLSDPAPLFELASEPNLYCKVSTIVLDAMGEEAPAFVERLVSHFGAERVMWGSDFSQTHDRSYAALVALAHRSFSALDEGKQRRCFVETPRSLWPSLKL